MSNLGTDSLRSKQSRSRPARMLSNVVNGVVVVVVRPSVQVAIVAMMTRTEPFPLSESLRRTSSFRRMAQPHRPLRLRWMST